MKLLPVLLVLAVVVSNCEGLSCLTCSEVSCEPLPACQWGEVKDACGCCTVCAKGPGESCGGPWNTQGVCGTGLTCRTKRRNSGQLGNPGEIGSSDIGKCRRSRN